MGEVPVCRKADTHKAYRKEEIEPEEPVVIQKFYRFSPFSKKYLCPMRYIVQWVKGKRGTDY
jgi:hypothetical protein